MKEIDIKKEEKKNVKIAITVVLILIMIPILIGIWIIYNLIAPINVSLKDITEDERNQIIQLLNLKIENDNIELKKIATSKYSNNYYMIYFYASNDGKIIYNKKQKSDFDIDLKKIGINKYRFTISNIGREHILVLEQIIDKYKK